MFRLTIVLLTLSLLLLSCSDDSNPSEPAPEHFAITINELPDTISAVVGTTQEVPFYVELKRDDGTVIEGELVELTDVNNVGQVIPPERISDETGEVHAVYSVEMPSEEQTSRIRVKTDDMTVSESITLMPVGRPNAILLESVSQPFKVDINTEAVIPIVAVVTDITGKSIPGVHIGFHLETVGNDYRFGTVQTSGITDDAGRTTTTFRSINKYGYIRVIALVNEPGFEDEVIGSLLLEIRPMYLPNSLYVHLSDTEFNISQMSPVDTNYTSTIETIVTDEDGIAIPVSPIFLATTHGRIVDNTLILNPAIDLPENASFIIEITAYNPDMQIEGKAEIGVTFLDDLPVLTLGTDRHVIEGDGSGGGQAILNVTLATPLGLPIPGQEITITGTENRCVIQSPVVTDSMGSATAVFDDIGQTGLVEITARSKFGTSESIDIEIEEFISRVERISLSLEDVIMMANSRDSTIVTAICSLVDGFPARPGTLVNFKAEYGSFSEESVHINSPEGIVQTFYYAGHSVVTDYVSAFVIQDEDTVFSNRVGVILQSGPPSIIVVHATPNELFTNDPDAYSTITATVMDTSSNPVRQGTHVTFSSTLGSVGQSAVTDFNGDAVVHLTPGGQAGLAVITATVDAGRGPITARATVIFVAGTPALIDLTADRLFAEFSQHPVTVALRATVRDSNGNLIMVPTPVVFEMVNEPPPPEGCMIGIDGQSFVSFTSSGVAVAPLNIGSAIGGKLIRAYTWRDSAARPDDIVSTVLSEFAVVSGPPFQLELSVNNRGEDAGGGAWELEVSARVWDIHRNPVQDNIPVVFTVEPEIANISAGFTGNENRNGEVVPGLAFANLVYNSISSLRDIEISADIQTMRGQITHTIDLILPVQGGMLFINEEDGDFVFDEEDEIIEARFNALLFDGHQIRIENAPLIFMADFGEFDPEQPGSWQATQDDIFFDPELDEQIVTFRVRIDGTDIVSDPLEIVVRRRLNQNQ